MPSSQTVRPPASSAATASHSRHGREPDAACEKLPSSRTTASGTRGIADELRVRVRERRARGASPVAEEHRGGEPAVVAASDARRSA